jgi:hypothetical protein
MLSFARRQKLIAQGGRVDCPSLARFLESLPEIRALTKNL